LVVTSKCGPPASCRLQDLLGLQGIPRSQQETSLKSIFLFTGDKAPTKEQEFEILLELCKAAFNTQQYPMFQRIACSALASKIIYQTPETSETAYAIATFSAYFNKDLNTAARLLKDKLQVGRQSNRLWNFLNHIFYDIGNNTTNFLRATNRLLKKNPTDQRLALFFANNCFLAGTYKLALCEFLAMYKNDPSAFLAFMIAVSFLQLACRKGTVPVNSLVAQGMGFLSQYREMRGNECEQETHYNFGRFFHHLGLFPTAMYHYKQVLVTTPLSPMYDLSREAAFNLSKIYMASESYEMARYYIEKYIVI